MVRLVRDQANKTFDIYLQRVRKYSETLPETVLRPAISSSNSAVATAAGPRMGTVQNDSSWAGWAISSFTNKISSARGEMQTRSSAANGSAGTAGSDTKRSISAPSVPHIHPSTVSKESVTSTAQPTIPIETNYFDDEPFADSTSNDLMNLEDIDEDIDAWGALGDMDDQDGPPSSEHTHQQTTTTQATKDQLPSKEKEKEKSSQFIAYDDSGEPDFAGWLAAQAQSKAKNKALPKGLTKKSTTTTTGNATSGLGKVGRASTTASVVKLPPGSRSSTKSTMTSTTAGISKTNKLPLPSKGGGGGRSEGIELGEAEENAWAEETSSTSKPATVGGMKGVTKTMDTKPRDDTGVGGGAAWGAAADDDDVDGWGDGWD